ncbi:MAG TPA: hypothetical protein VGR62_21170 [Candidatus Binatia bacterium]|jgi:6-phosphogluconolactonase (cycloisomerase 2 family)|nr:hypothetical protein [Candidatus Binatia bacterium]
MRRPSTLIVSFLYGVLASTPAPAADFLRDGILTIDASQIRDTSDGENPGRAWEAFLPFPAPVTVAAGDSLHGTIAFGSGLLRLRDDGGGFFVVGAVEGFEQLIVSANQPGPPQQSMVDTASRFTDLRGPALVTGGARLGNINDNGLFLQVVEDFVGPTQDVFVSGITYRLDLISGGGPFTFDGLDLRVLAEALEVTARPPGDLAYRTCLTGETETGVDGTEACTAVEGHTAGGANSGLDNLRSLAISADGTSLYAVSGFDDAVAHFERDTSTGALAYQGCLTGETESGSMGSGACTEIAGAAASGEGSGLDLLQSVVLSADGTSLYTASVGDHAIGRFDRDVTTGALTYQGCIAGESGAACAALTSATVSGDDSGLDGVRAVVVSADGTSLYAAATGDDAVARFDRDPTTGALTYQGCITGESESGPTGSGACVAIASAAPSGADSGLDDVFGLALSADGTSLYVVSRLDDAVARFERDPTTGALTYQGCLTGENESGPTGSGACTPIATSATNGTNSGLDELYALVVSPDDASVYAVAESDDAVVRFDRDPATGALTYAGCITGENETGPAGSDACAAIGSAAAGGTSSGLDKLRSLAISADGISVYVGSPADDAVARFERDPASGAIVFVSCLSGERETGRSGTGACDEIGSATTFGSGSGIDNPQSITVSADGGAVVIASGNDAAVARFDREPLAPAPPTTTTTTTTTTSSSSSTLAVTTTTTSSSTTTTSSTTSTTLPPATPVAGRSLLITDHRVATKRKIELVTALGSGLDPVADGVVLQVFGSDDAVCFDLPTSGWKAKGKAGKRTFKYTDAAFAHGPCKSATIKDGKTLSVVCKATAQPIAFSLDEPSQGAVAVRFGSGNHTYCAMFGGTVKDVQEKKFSARNAPAPPACPAVPIVCP